MFCETVQTPGKKKLHDHAEADRQHDDNDDDKIEEIEISANNAGHERVDRMADKFASTRLGQMLLKKADRTLRVLEATAKWSLPQDDADFELERPLPWLFFLMLIICLRLVRIVLSIGYYTVGAQPSTPHSMVYYLQTKRRRLRALRLQGLKTIRNRENGFSVIGNLEESPRLMGKWGTLISRLICKPALHGELLGRYGPERHVNIVEDVTKRSGKRPRDDDDIVGMHDLTVSEMLDKFGNEDSDNDSDYVPPPGVGDDDVSTSSASTSSAEETAIENKNSDPEAEANKTEDDAQDLQKDDEETESEKETSQIEKTRMGVEQQREEDTGATKKILRATEEERKQEIKENGKRKYNAKFKPVEENQFIVVTTAHSDNEEMQTPKEIPAANGGGAEISELPVAAREVAPESVINTPRTALNQLAFPQMAENTMKSTPGHETAATEKPLLNKPINLGSLQDFHTIFHPTPIEKVAPAEAQSSTTRETDMYDSSTLETPEPVTSGSQRRNINPSSQNKHYYYYNSKNRTKIRR